MLVWIYQGSAILRTLWLGSTILAKSLDFEHLARARKAALGRPASDQFLDLLKPESLAEAITERRQPATLRMQPGYDHSYFFVSTFMGEHVAFHADALA